MRAHNNIKQFVCNVGTCDKWFYSQRSLESHQRTYTNAKLFMCHQCGKPFAHSQSLKEHLLTHQPGAQTVKCQFCVKTFKSVGAVYRHCRTSHLGVMKAFCEICNLHFVSDADLNRHNKYHHMSKYDGTAEERTFLSATAELTTTTHRHISLRPQQSMSLSTSEATIDRDRF